ncbi:hypothetical protein DRQ09_06400 [candidate division KSB1 bacterium]|nr:MAG: hypothetical protein DRQ09_06400 [candidate division KSB1 bacterium]
MTTKSGFHKNCFACGINDYGLKLRFVIKDNESYGEFKAIEKFQGYDNILNGGIISTILDSAMVNILLERGIKALTASLEVRMKKYIKIGEKIKIKASLIKEKGKLFIIESELFNNNGILATGKGKFLQVDFIEEKIETGRENI